MRYRAKKIYLTCVEETVRAWVSYILGHIDEAVQSLQGEGVRHEMWFLGQDHDGLFLIGVADVDDHGASVSAFQRSELPVDAVHRAFKTHWDRDRSVKLEIDPAVQPSFGHCELLLDIRANT